MRANPMLDPVCRAHQGYVHSVETAGTVDGPGIRFVLFLMGCPLRCAYCHNPDTWQLRKGELRPDTEVLEEIAGYAGFLKRAGGGVTISGGEPLMQPAFLQSLFRGCRELGLHTALDTSGLLGHLAPDALLDLVDLVLLDIKAGNGDLHRKVTGKPLDPVLTFAHRLRERRQPVWIRHVLVPGLTDGEEELRQVARIVRDLDNVERVDLLPFHQLGSYKWRELNQAYSLTETPSATGADLDRARSIFADEGVTAL